MKVRCIITKFFNNFYYLLIQYNIILLELSQSMFIMLQKEIAELKCQNQILKNRTTVSNINFYGFILSNI
jgi:hypothetical protein